MRKLINQKNFLRINAITLGSVFVLILVGSIVRVMGAGMGCPDWPKCFGSYIPPTSAETLPENYQDVFREQRIAKNERLSGLFSKLGYQELSEKITKDPAVLVEHEFNATKAWIEYINRLVGVLIGLLVFLNMVLSFSFRKKSIWIPIMGVAIFILTGFQGWVGSLVVSTNLLHGFITFHMLLALLIVALLIWMNVRVRELKSIKHKPLFIIGLLTTLLFIPQIILGTEVRGVIDDLLVSTTGRSEWVNYLSSTFYVHRSYSWLILIGVVSMFYFARKVGEGWLVQRSMQLVMLVFIAMIAGIAMVRFDFPFWVQPLHLILAVGIFSLLFYLTLRLKFEK
ncbi:COX15/CtaA family protein [Ekhidna sp. MALMAid0563]|uniref:COX15/CtaA family protein n=1 Tax=Ekhidna sp. MALMAid0563 TaxID=3143937 RepID=UPI0032DE6A38